MTEWEKFERMVSLKSDKVELGIVEDITAYNKGFEKMFAELQGLQKRGERLKAELSDTISAIYKMGELSRSMGNDMADLLVDFGKKAKELGVDPNTNKVYAEGQSKFKAYMETEKAAQRLAESFIKIR
jgi:hypothetical protein